MRNILAGMTPPIPFVNPRFPAPQQPERFIAIHRAAPLLRLSDQSDNQDSI
jgi:hypothetical protein